jgi:hypothetical protein
VIALSYVWPPEWMQELKDWAQLAAWFAAIIGGSIAAQRAIAEMRASRHQREEELRWKQANSAKELITDIHHHPLASSAVRMLDWSEGATDYQLSPTTAPIKIRYAEVLSGLQKPQVDSDDVEKYVQECFDWFFYYIDRIQHYIDRGLVTFADVQSVFKAYAIKISCHKDIYEKFMSSKQYDLALKFWRQCTEYAQGETGPSQGPGSKHHGAGV